MAVAVVVPNAGDSVLEARLASWLVEDGQAVQVDQPIFELETDKLTQPIPSPSAGVIHITVPAGEIVKIGQTVAEVDPSAAPAPTKKPTPEAKPEPVAKTAANEAPTPSPAAAAHIRDNGMDVRSIPATGPGNRITKTDVLDALSSQSAPAKTPAPIAPRPVNNGERETRTAMTNVRKTIAARLLQSQQSTATLTTFNEADMTAVQDLRAKYNDKFEKKHGIKLGFSSLFVKAAVEALKAFPMVNARIDGSDIVSQHFYDIGMAVSTENGLVVPIIRDADLLTFSEIEKAVGDLAKRARDRKLGMGDMQGGTFTITNGGIFGSMMSTPILNPPQTAILGLHAIQKRPVAINDQVVIRPMMYLALSYDHRMIDGREAVQFLVRIKECIENPERMLFDI